MLVCIPNVLDAGQIVSLRARSTGPTAWIDGRVTAGYQGAPSSSTNRSTRAPT
jgi:PKHD-type hydroxylase